MQILPPLLSCPVRTQSISAPAEAQLPIDAIVTLYHVPNYAPPTPLPKTKSALSFALHHTIEHTEIPRAASPSVDGKGAIPNTVPSVVTYLAAGCRRKIVIYTWKDGDLGEIIVRKPVSLSCVILRPTG